MKASTNKQYNRKIYTSACSYSATFFFSFSLCYTQTHAGARANTSARDTMTRVDIKARHQAISVCSGTVHDAIIAGLGGNNKQVRAKKAVIKTSFTARSPLDYICLERK